MDQYTASSEISRTSLTAATRFKPKWFVPSDMDGYFGILIDNLVNLLFIATTLSGLFKMPDWIVYGRVIPASVLAVCIGNIYYVFMARRLARRERRHDVTALPYGISTPVMFAYMFLIIGPVYWSTGDAETAWKVGACATLIGGCVEMLGTLIGPTIRKFTPRAALLGTLAGIAIAWMAVKPSLAIWGNPIMAFVPMAIILVGFIGRVRMPFGLPTGAVAIIAGIILAWITGMTSTEQVVTASKSIGLHLPTLSISALKEGFSGVTPFLMVILPMGAYNFIETMNNVESAAAAGDNYPTGETMLVDGIGTTVAALFGGCFPTTVYIGHPGWKALGARSGYSWMNGVSLLLVGCLGCFALVESIVPTEVAMVILLYVALTVGSQSFQTVNKKYAPAILMAFIPHISSFTKSNMDQVITALGSTGTSATQAFTAAGIQYETFAALGDGAIISGLILGAATAFIIDRKFLSAALYLGVGSLLSFFGLIHSSSLGWAAAPAIALGYLLTSGVMLLFALYARIIGSATLDNNLIPEETWTESEEIER